EPCVKHRIDVRLSAHPARYRGGIRGIVTGDLLQQMRRPHRETQGAPAEIPAPQFIELRSRHEWPGALDAAEEHRGAAGHGFQGTAGFGEYQVVAAEKDAG